MDAVNPDSPSAYFRALGPRPERLSEIWPHWNRLLAAEADGVELSRALRTAGVAAASRKARRPEGFFEDMRAAYPAWQAKILPVLPAMAGRDLAPLPLAFARLRLLPPDDFLPAFETAIRPSLPHIAFNRHIGLLLGYGQLGLIPHADILESVLQKTQQWLDRSASAPQAPSSMNFGDTAYALGALALADFLQPRPVYTRMAAQALTLIRQLHARKAQHTESYGMVHDAGEWFGLPHADLPWPDNDNVTSTSERGLRDHFLGLNMRLGHQQLRRYERLNKATDFMVFNHTGERLWVEFDGPSHFLVQPGAHKVAYDGSTRFQSALMRRVNPERPLVRIPYMTLGLNPDERRIRRRQLSAAFNGLGTDQAPQGRALVLVMTDTSHHFVPL
jgi:hypothetical protein